MTERELKKLKRVELLEILIAQSKENEELRARLKAAEDKLKDRRIAIERSGSIAEAALRLNGVFEAAQKAAEDYVRNVKISAARLK